MCACSVASSEVLKTADASVAERFRYRYIVYHCAHYGEPRKRGRYCPPF